MPVPTVTLLLLIAACAAGPQTDQKPEPAPKESQAEDKKPEPTPTVLGKTNTTSGEARRNENVFISAVDNNVQKEVNIRTGTTATINPEFNSANRYYGSEYGNAPAGPFHIGDSKLPPGLHAQAYWTNGNSVFSARSFFQAGPVKPARDNQYGLRITAGLWKNAFGTLEGSESSASGSLLRRPAS